MAVILGQRRVRFWFGKKFVFERVGVGEWLKIEGPEMIPEDIVNEVKKWS